MAISSRYRRPYVDSSVIIAWLRDEEKNGQNCGAIFEDILKAAETGIFPLITSALTIAEVFRVKGSPEVDYKQSQTILEFFEWDFIKIVSLERHMAESAHVLCREHKLMPCDGIHLASALKYKCDVLWAWDGPLSEVERPDISIEAPRIVRGQADFSDMLQE